MSSMPLQNSKRRPEKIAQASVDQIYLCVWGAETREKEAVGFPVSVLSVCAENPLGTGGGFG
jgi:hypothetical protein